MSHTCGNTGRRQELPCINCDCESSARPASWARDVEMTAAQTTTLWLGAFRYYVGRMTYAVGDFCDLLIATWPTLPESTRNLIHRDLEEEFLRDDEARERRVCHLPLGYDCDRNQWERVRALWLAPNSN